MPSSRRARRAFADHLLKLFRVKKAIDDIDKFVLDCELFFCSEQGAVKAEDLEHRYYTLLTTEYQLRRVMKQDLERIKAGGHDSKQTPDNHMRLLCDLLSIAINYCIHPCTTCLGFSYSVS